MWNVKPAATPSGKCVVMVMERKRMESGHVGSVVWPAGLAGSSPALSSKVGWPSGEALVCKTS
jgi:hypothetical protein